MDVLWLQGRKANFVILWNRGYVLVYLCSAAVALEQRSYGLAQYLSKLLILFVSIESYAQLKGISRFEQRLIIIIISCMSEDGLDW
jgi:hypothetical protein